MIYSDGKFLCAPASGGIAGRRDLTRAAYLQYVGISRGMTVAEESIAGVIAAMEQWMERDAQTIHAEERAERDL